MIQIIGIAVVGAVATVLGIASRKPAQFRMQRTARINAPPDRIYPHLVDFHRWAAWSPWEKLDPAMKRTISGAPSGKGAVYEWEGNSKAGKGRMEITDTTAQESVTIDLQFIKPFAARNTTVFALEPRGAATDVTWSMSGESPFVQKVMSVFVDMDKMVGKDFEQGLANLKTLAEQ
jgi:hypothetical protein